MSGPISRAQQVSANIDMASRLKGLGTDPQLRARQWQKTLVFYAAVHWVKSRFQQMGYPGSRISPAINAVNKCGTSRDKPLMGIVSWRPVLGGHAAVDGFQLIPTLRKLRFFCANKIFRHCTRAGHSSGFMDRRLVGTGAIVRMDDRRHCVNGRG